jgi:class 3 adenylate cyclase
MHLVHVHNALTRGALKEHNGREVKHTGDGMMASFTRVLDAVDCGVAIQKAFAAHNATAMKMQERNMNAGLMRIALPD